MSPGSPGFREESFQPCAWSQTPWGRRRTRHDRSTSLLPSPCQDKVGHHKRMFSELNTRPGCTSVNASPWRLPADTHHSRPRRLARSYLVRLFHPLLSSGLCRAAPGSSSLITFSGRNALHASRIGRPGTNSIFDLIFGSFDRLMPRPIRAVASMARAAAWSATGRSAAKARSEKRNT